MDGTPMPPFIPKQTRAEDPAVYYLSVFGEGPVKSTWKFAVDQVDSR
jgi:hypothetical protein